MIFHGKNVGIVEESPRRLQDSRNPNGSGSEEIGKLVPDSLYESFADHHRRFGRTDEHIVFAYIHNSRFYFQTNGQVLRSEKYLRKPTGIEPDFRFRGYHKGLDIREESRIRGSIGTNRFRRISELGELPEDPEKECGHENGSNRREDISPSRTEILEQKRIRHHRYRG